MDAMQMANREPRGIIQIPNEQRDRAAPFPDAGSERGRHAGRADDGKKISGARKEGEEIEREE